MSYLVLARKWRPRKFSEMAGQEHVLRALMNALEHDRLHHAFLFAGTRGVGKTTVARILAKAINCEAGVSAEPCGACSACLEIDEGRFVDLIEVDAASRTRVDDTRDLLDNVQYAPTRARYKVYLIDEVHMLSAHSFNALLKTLEEPPPHVKFLLATTDPQKLPVTVLSRCLQFNLKRLSPSLIEERMEMIAGKEDIQVEAGALARIARAADGSMRDALSLLDQAIAYGGGRLLDAEVADMLGSIDHRHVLALLEALTAGDGPALIAATAHLEEEAPDFAGVLDDIASALQRIALAQHVPEALAADTPDRADLLDLSAKIPAEDVQLFYQIALNGRRDLPLAPDPRGGFEMILLRMLAFRPEGPPPDTPASSGPPGRAAGTTGRGASAGGTGRSSSQTGAAARPAATGGAVPELAAADWSRLVDSLEVQGAARQLASNCELLGCDGELIELRLDAAHLHLLTPQQNQRLEEALTGALQRKVRLRIDAGEPQRETPARRVARKADEQHDAARTALESDPNVQSLERTFGARIRDETVEPRAGKPTAS